MSMIMQSILQETSAQQMPVSFSPGLREDWLDCWFAPGNAEKFVDLYHDLADEASKKVLIKLVAKSLAAFKTSRREASPFFPLAEWQKMLARARQLKDTFPSYDLDLVETFVLEGYAYDNLYKAASGWTVFDCGAYTGNTSLYFSRLVGESGRVFAFEPSCGTYEQLVTNIQNSGIKNIATAPFAVCNHNGTITFSVGNGAGARIANTGLETRAITLDSFATSENLDKVDMIKMDIEGAELDALKGAERIIRRDTPLLAICVYHKKDDFINIPDFISKLDLGYKLYLKHNSTTFNETVLFAVTPCLLRNKESLAFKGNEEAGALAAWWNSTKLSIKEFARQLRCERLQSCVAILAGMGVRLAPIFDEKGCNYVYFPISDEPRIHFEILFSSGKTLCALHFETDGDWEQLGSQICDLWHMKRKLDCRKPAPRRLSMNCACYDNTNAETAARILKYLMDIALPVLEGQRLVDDSKFFQI